MSGRIAIRAGELAEDSAEAIYGASDREGEPLTEVSLRESFRAALDDARARGLRSVAATAPETRSLPLRRCAEVLLEEARRHLASETCIDEIRFLLPSEPAYRLFEAVNDSIRIAERAIR